MLVESLQKNIQNSYYIVVLYQKTVFKIGFIFCKVTKIDDDDDYDDDDDNDEFNVFS